MHGAVAARWRCARNYQAGVYHALSDARLPLNWVAGISIGAINSALIAGNAPEPNVTAKHGLIGLAKVMTKKVPGMACLPTSFLQALFEPCSLKGRFPNKRGQLRTSEQTVVKEIMLKETVDGEFTTIADVAQAALFFAAF